MLCLLKFCTFGLLIDLYCFGHCHDFCHLLVWCRLAVGWQWGRARLALQVSACSFSALTFWICKMPPYGSWTWRHLSVTSVDYLESLIFLLFRIQYFFIRYNLFMEGWLKERLWLKFLKVENVHGSLWFLGASWKSWTMSLWQRGNFEYLKCVQLQGFSFQVREYVGGI